MTDKINGVVSPDQFLVGNLNFYTVHTTKDIQPTGKIGDASQKLLDKVVATISTRAQPIILGAVQKTDNVSVVDAGKLGLTVAAPATVYTLRFAIEHNQAWEVTDSFNPAGAGVPGLYQNPTLKATLVATGEFTADEVAVLMNTLL